MIKRIDSYLVEKGHAQSRERAKIMILSGGVQINGKTVKKPSESVSESDMVTVSVNDLKYVGRGALKLEHAFTAFQISVKDRICADIGASTGGFTEILLEQGAAKVYAVDVGHGQLAERIAVDSRVINCEGTNVKDLTPAFFQEPVTFMSVDLSFISLKNVMKILANCLESDGEMAVLIKPQFEAGKKALNKNGIVKDKKTHISILGELLLYFRSCGMEPLGLDYSPITGGDGNIEYLACLKKRSDNCNAAIDINKTVEAAFAALKKR